MSIAATLRLALRSLMRNKVRTWLTMLGIIIGIGSVIAMIAVGQGASMMIQQQVNAMGRNLLMVHPGARSSGGFSFGAGSVTTLTPEDGVAIQKELRSVKAVTPVVRTRAQVVYENRNWFVGGILGVGVEFLDVREWNVDEGGFFSNGDILSANKVCILGQTVAKNLFDESSPVGSEIRIKNVPFKVIGLLSRKGTNAMGMDQDDTIVIPWTTVKRTLQGSAFNNVDTLLATAVSAAAIPEATREITAILRQRHKIAAGDESDFSVLPMTEMASQASQMANTMTVLLAVIASISLVVGGIGIMNIMLVSVVERTREIGVRMAVGARGADILLQFLTESVVISLAAGALGILIGIAASTIISQTLRWPTQISPESIAMAFLFSCGVGVFFGLYPALRASRLDPIEALRYE